MAAGSDETRSPDETQAKRGLRARAFALLFLPSAALAAPLLFHASPEPVLGPYGARYACLLAGVAVVVTALSTACAIRCVRRASLRPAFAAFSVLLACVGVAFAAELSLRARYDDSFSGYRAWGHRKSALFGFEAAPNARWEGAGAVYTTDRLGFRSHLSGRGWIDSDGPRIFALGASSVFGYGLNDDETWPHRLEAKLREARPDVNVINAGNNGHNSLQLVLRFFLRVLPHRPDVVLFYENINEAEEEGLGPEGIWITEDVLFSTTMADYTARRHPNANLYRRTLLAEALFPEDEPVPEKEDDPTRELRPEEQRIVRDLGARYRRNLEVLLDMCARHGVRPVLLTFLIDASGIPPLRSRSVEHNNRLLREMARAERVELIDLAQRFEPVRDKQTYFYEDHYHPNARGAEFIASHVAEALRDDVGERAAASSRPSR